MNKSHSHVQPIVQKHVVEYIVGALHNSWQSPEKISRIRRSPRLSPAVYLCKMRLWKGML